MNSLKGYRTYILAALGILTAWIYFLVGDLSMKEAVEATFAALATATLAARIKNNGIAGVVKVIGLMGAMGLMGALTACKTVEGGTADLRYVDDGTLALGYSQAGTRAEILRTAAGQTSYSLSHRFGPANSGKRVVPSGK